MKPASRAVVALCLGLCIVVAVCEAVPAKDSRDNLVHIVKRNVNSTSSFPVVPVAVGGGVGVLVLMFVVVALVILCVCCLRKRETEAVDERRPILANGYAHERYSDRTTRESSVAEALSRERRAKEELERNKAGQSVQYFLRNNTQYRYESDLNDLGSRMQKHWFKVTCTEQEGERRQMLLLTTTPVSQKCPLRLDNDTVKGMNRLVKELRKHPFLQPINIIDYLPSLQQLVIVQPFHDGGSLKDTIYRATPTTDWSNKYSRRSRGLTVDRVQLYGRQILEAMLFLYERGFPQLGHVQSGNVFVVNDTCLVGGYENTLLGYKTRVHKMCKDCLERLDVIMFGHLLFEMCCGYELTSVTPTERDYKSAKMDEVSEILHFVFNEEDPPQVEDVRNHDFFSVSLQSLDDFDPSTVKTSTGSIEHVLEKVRKGKPRQQKIPRPKKAEFAPPLTPPIEHPVTPPPAPPTARPVTPPPPQPVTPPPTREIE